MVGYDEIKKQDIKTVYDMLYCAFAYSICKYDVDVEEKCYDEFNVKLFLQEDSSSLPIRITIDAFINSGKLYARNYEIYTFDETSWRTSKRYFYELIDYRNIKDLPTCEAELILNYLKQALK